MHTTRQNRPIHATRCVQLLALALLLALPAVAHAGAWNQKPGAVYAKIWGQGIVGGLGYFAGPPSEALDALYGDISANVYVEWGLHRYLTVILQGRPLGYATVATDTQHRKTAYIGPLGVGFRVGLPTGKFKLAFEAHYAYAPPVGEVQLGRGVTETGKQWLYTPVSTTHRLDGTLQLGMSFALGKGYYGWFNLSPGLRYQSRSSLGSAFHGMAQFGVSMPFALVIDLHFNVYLPFQEITSFNIAGASNTRYLGFGLTLSYWFTKRVALTAAIEGVFLAYANAATPTMILGVELRFGPE